MKRWPGFVYDRGEEPDYRFTFANERTYLAWIRTSLAMLAAGVALDVVNLSIHHVVQTTAAVVFVSLGLAAAAVAWVRWALSERAMRRGEPLPSFGFAALITLAFIATAVAATLALLLTG